MKESISLFVFLIVFAVFYASCSTDEGEIEQLKSDVKIIDPYIINPFINAWTSDDVKFIGPLTIKPVLKSDIKILGPLLKSNIKIHRKLSQPVIKILGPLLKSTIKIIDNDGIKQSKQSFKKDFQSSSSPLMVTCGQVISYKNGLPISGVSVVIKGTAISTLTDSNGDYCISPIYGEEVLVFSLIGCETVELTLGTAGDCDAGEICISSGNDVDLFCF